MYNVTMNIIESLNNMLPIILSGIGFMLIGTLWYSPMLFGTAWQKEVGLKNPKKGETNKMIMPMIGSFVLALVMANVLGYLIKIMGLTEILDSMMLAFILWLGFVATTNGINILYQGKNPKLFFIDSGFQLVIMICFAFILTVL